MSTTRLTRQGRCCIKRREQALLFLRKAAQDEAHLDEVIESRNLDFSSAPWSGLGREYDDAARSLNRAETRELL
ncbi:hypothetical protein F183_A07830 [Bryobacterales bacterium F-183]|nr:hypothetical protein F183_A07830 [Bryobacterales bacterium F-183]